MENADDLVSAISADFGYRPKSLSRLTDIAGTILEIRNQKAGLRRWSKRRSVAPIGSLLGLTQHVYAEPLGVVGVIGAWNFPVHLSLTPVGTALAAGNSVVLRPPPETPETANLLKSLAGQYFSSEVFSVVTEEEIDGAGFASAPFDHLFFTGSSKVGALVGQAAARNLVPVTLELGGRNPVVVDRSADLEKSASFIADARVVNAGQVCICPDYALVPDDLVDDFVDRIQKRWQSTLPVIAGSPYYTTIVNDRHYSRINELVEDASDRGANVLKHVPSGEALPDPIKRTIPPTLVVRPPSSARILSEEVFGPVLTILSYNDFDQMVEHLATQPSPLVLYWCGETNANRKSLIERTRSGAVNCNDMATHLLSPSLPFGGVGKSGHGRYHGRFGFETFSYLRPVTFSRIPVRAATIMGLPNSLGARGTDLILRRFERFRRSRSKMVHPNS